MVCERSDDDGRYALAAGLGVWRFGAAAQGYAPSVFGPSRLAGSVVTLTANAELELDFVMDEPGWRVHGVVRDALGGVVEGARVLIASHPSIPQPGSLARTDEDGAFELFAGPRLRMLTAYAEGYAPGIASFALDGRVVEIVLVPETVVQGVVVWGPRGEPLANVEVLAKKAGARTRSDARGRFELPVLTQEDELLIARGPGVAGSLALTGGDPGEPREVELVVDAGADLELMLTLAGQPCKDGYVVEVTSLVREVVRVWGEPVVLSGLAPGEVELELGCRGARLDSLRLELAAGERERRRVDLEPTGALTGRVVGREGEPSPRTLVQVRGPMELSALCDARGEFSFEVLPPGRYEVSARARRLGMGAGPVTIELDRDGSFVELELQARATVGGVLRTPRGEPAAGVWMSIVGSEPGRSAGFTVTDDEGRFSFPALESTEHSVFAGGLRLAQTGEAPLVDHVEVSIVDAAPIELELVLEARERSLEVEVVDGSGAAVAGVAVRAQREGAGLGSSLDVDLGTHISDAEGRARFEGVPGGTLEISALGTRVQVTEDARQARLVLDR
ncbi:hypothetical protein G6O69_15630 [Pseudenhygromyxa sp. WMMC2535]|uniref:carboxypeptidase regulatory-like domain-containing protein n=1 Tax=Pseudenhygromyxa sp. WMMC2535 TaxID=2712867 RepID=UPI001552D616|nr:carboxypeptidase regulatory-like domain-containing protein [Pseudenhygromyxa sp. WMMC2535]NVB39274.1 hypothetical protein [Pseudenhygromyxa sp. WMMC2535]